MADQHSEFSEVMRADRPWTPATRLLGHPVVYYPVVESTQHLAHTAARAGAAEGLVILADEQQAGKGRLGRRWLAPFGSSLLMSILFRPNLAAVQASRLTMCVGLGAAEAIEAQTGLTVQLKWPNDLFVARKKLAGLLTETFLDGDRLVYAIVGLGLNANVWFAPADELATTATSLAMALGHPVDRVPLLQAVLQRIETHYVALQNGESPASAWAARLVGLGEPVRVNLIHGVLTGTAEGVDPDGALLLRTSDGITHTIWAGDVSLVRPAAESSIDY